MSIIDVLVYDRTQEDLINDTDKAFISYTDLNRVEEAVKYLSEMLNLYGYSNRTNTKTNWLMSDFRKIKDCERIKENYEILKKAYSYKFDVPDFNWTTIEEANNIEKILKDINEMLKGMEQLFVKSGVSCAGQSRLWQQRFRRSKNWIALAYSLDKYNQNWNTVSDVSNEVSEIPLDERTPISVSLNTWNDKLNYIDTIAGGVET